MNDTVDQLDLTRDARKAISEEAAYRKISMRRLVEKLLEAVAKADQFGDVLQKGGQT